MRFSGAASSSSVDKGPDEVDRTAEAPPKATPEEIPETDTELQAALDDFVRLLKKIYKLL